MTDGTEPGEDLCLACHHPDHEGLACAALVGVFYAPNEPPEPDLCDCRGWTPPATAEELASVTPDPWMVPGPTGEAPF